MLAIWLLASTKKAPSAAELSRQLGVTVKTAWLMRRKIAQAMARREGELLRRGIVELDEGFIGGKRTRPASRGRLQPGKTMVASAAGSVVQTDAWKGYAALGRARVRPSSLQAVHRRRRRSVAALVAHRALQLQALDTGYLPRRQPWPPAGLPRRVLLPAQSPRPTPGPVPTRAQTAASSTPAQRPIRCSQAPERRGWACRGPSSFPLHQRDSLDGNTGKILL